MGEHDDDVGPSVDVGAEVETAKYPSVSEDFEEAVEDEGAPAPAAVPEEPGDHDDGQNDTI